MRFFGEKYKLFVHSTSTLSLFRRDVHLPTLADMILQLQLLRKQFICFRLIGRRIRFS